MKHRRIIFGIIICLIGISIAVYFKNQNYLKNLLGLNDKTIPVNTIKQVNSDQTDFGEVGILKSEAEEQRVSEQMEIAMTTPFGKYPELITYTLGKMTGTNRSNMPEGDTYENNAYTRYIYNLLNIQNMNKFEAEGIYYDNIVSMAISDQDIPDIMVVSDLTILKNLVYSGAIEDLTTAYENCASDRIKEIYDSYQGKALDAVTFDGKIMAIPDVNISYGPNLLWIRKDWLDKLGLELPESLEDMEYVIRQFIEKDPGGNGEGKTIGLLCDQDISGNYDLEYQMDIIFASFEAFPKKWVLDGDGNAVYGSITKETRKALEYLSRLYQEGILDNQFLMRNNENNHELIIEGKSGAFFGPWWAPNNPLMEAYQKDPEANWVPCFIKTSEDGSCTTYSQKASGKYVVVRKGFEHPEIAVKLVSALFDSERTNNDNVTEIQGYYAANVDPTARPIAINVDYHDAYFRSSEHIKEALDGTRKRENLSVLEKSYYDMCVEYLESDKPNPEQWAAYMSRIVAASELKKGTVHYVEDVLNGQTKTIQSQWWMLEQLEKDAFLKIITGVQPIESVDTFVGLWKERGGVKITKEVNESLEN